MKPNVALTLLVFGSSAGIGVTWASPYSYTNIDFPGGGYTVLSGINNAGQIVGTSFSTVQIGFLDTNGSFTTIDAGPSNNFTRATIPHSINNASQIAGDSFPRGPFLYANGAFTFISLSVGSGITGINDSGQLVGDSLIGPVSHGFLDTNGTFTTIDFPGVNGTTASGINNAGQIVGCTGSPVNNCVHGFLDTNGVFTPIDFPGANSTIAIGINDAGQIVGAYLDSTNHQHGFLATPIGTSLPEPGSLLLFASGLAAIVILIVRRRMTRTSSQ